MAMVESYLYTLTRGAMVRCWISARVHVPFIPACSGGFEINFGVMLGLFSEGWNFYLKPSKQAREGS